MVPDLWAWKQRQISSFFTQKVDNEVFSILCYFPGNTLNSILVKNLPIKNWTVWSSASFSVGNVATIFLEY